MGRASADLDSTKFKASFAVAMARMFVNSTAAINDLGEQVVTRAKVKAPKGDPATDENAGELERSIGIRARGYDAEGPFCEFVVASDHAAAQEFGARPHIIRSHGDYPLRNRKTGQVFGKVVHHPGNAPQPYARPAIAESVARWRPKIVPEA